MARRNAGARFRELGAELRGRREAAGVTGTELARRTGWSATTITRIETGQTPIEPVDMVVYLVSCGVRRPQAMEFLARCRDAERRLGYWLSPHGEWLEDSLGALIFHETTAAASTTYEPLLVPGLLQTAKYARARIAAERWRSPENMDQCLHIRLKRQRILHLPLPARFRFFVQEQALRLEVGNPAVMHEQMLKLVLTAALDHIILRVLPSAAGEHSQFGGPFVVFEYAEYPPLVYMHASSNGLFLDDKEFIAPFRKLVPAIAEVALDEGQSRQLIAALASEYDQRSERNADDRLEEEHL